VGVSGRSEENRRYVGTYMIAKVKEKNKSGIIAANGPARLDVSLDNFYQRFTIELVSEEITYSEYCLGSLIYISFSAIDISHLDLLKTVIF
jgi:hypothetical protein